MDQPQPFLLHHQKFMLAVRREMGWPGFRPANDCLFFASGRLLDAVGGADLARISQQGRKDVIYSGWTNTRAKQPAEFAIAYRELLTVDIVTRLVPWCADAEAPICLVSTRDNEMFALDGRGTLARTTGKPPSLARGRQLAMRRIVARSKMMGDGLLDNNRAVPTGGDWCEPDVPMETVVRFC